MGLKKQRIKNMMLPLAMIGGAVFYKWMGYLTFLSPYLIILMLFITYCKLDYKDFRPTGFHLLLLTMQMILAGIVYVVVASFNHTVAEGVFICVFIPTATAAPVITSMLGGSIAFVATYSLLCNLLVAAVAPVILAIIGDSGTMDFLSSMMLICSKVFPILILPLIGALLCGKVMPRFHSYCKKNPQLSFFLWAFSLFIVVGSCVSFIINNWCPQDIWNIILLAIGALAVCVLQFILGRRIGRKFGDAVSGGQSLGQKNTVLAVWLAMAYMTPVASVAPAAYIAWQNIINSWQLIRYNRRNS